MDTPSKKISGSFIWMMWALFVLIIVGFVHLCMTITDYQPIHRSLSQDCQSQCQRYTYTPLLAGSEYRRSTDDKDYCICTLRKQ